MSHTYYYRIEYFNGESTMCEEGITTTGMLDHARQLAKKNTNIVYWDLPEYYDNSWLYFRKVVMPNSFSTTVNIHKHCFSQTSLLLNKVNLNKIYSNEELTAYNEAITHYKNYLNKRRRQVK